MDFYQICTREIESGPRKGSFEIYPDFRVGRSKDLMVRGRSFYAVWDEKEGLWSTDEYDVQRLIDEELAEYAAKMKAETGIEYHVKYLRSFSNHGWSQFRKFLQNISDNSHQLDQKLTFSNSDVKKTDYVSRRLPYALEPGDISAWNELVGTLYSVEERAKIEWGIGAIVSGDSKRIQKFFVLYGPPGHGKGTIINVLLKLFPGYTAAMDAKALGSSSATFATEVFKDNPLVAFQQDGDLSKIEDNARLNSIISHEDMNMNEKFKPGYTAKVNAILWLGTNKPVKISDAKSGIIRRLIDIHPTGVTIPTNHYHSLMARIDFELGAIAQHCLEVYREMGKNYYNGYRPTEMMLQTDIFFNFIEANYDVFKAQNSTTLRQAYELYKQYCADTGIQHVSPQYKVREELRNYFEVFKDRAVIEGGESVRSYYEGFTANKFKQATEDKETPFALVIEETESIFDEQFALQPAQYGTPAETPRRKWEIVKTKLEELDTAQLHFVKVPEHHIVIDFDLKSVNGKKSLERNLAAASEWPPTYAELSKGGNGIHLHYNYDGDVHELSSQFSEGIEVKTLLGDASLRRRLTKCNNVPVATLKKGYLPIKEKKMLSEKRIQSEKGLRDLIMRNLRKEIHPGTKPSIDFIKKILDEAYESGMQYDLTDMRNRITAFANNSSNRPLECLKIVQQMHFSSETSNSDVDLKVEDERLVFWDVEVYPNLFVICWKFQGSPTIVRMINPSPQEIERLLKLKLVGFNNRRYDNHILYAAYMGYDNQALYELSQKIINGVRSAMFGEAYNLSFADIYDFSSKKQSLKKFMIELGMTHLELDIPWDQPVAEELWPKVVEYCCNDVEGTEGTFEARKQDYVARQILADLSGLSINDTTQRHTARIIFGKDRQPQQKFVYTHLAKDFPGYKYEMGKSTYRGEEVGEGGYVYAEPGMYENVIELDIASMHPTSIEQLNLFGEYTPNFAALKAARVAIKHGDYDTAGVMLGGKLKPYLKKREDAKDLSYALKIVINIVYGLTSARFDNPFKDKRNVDNIVAKRGALFMVDLKNACQERGLQVVHIKTDSIKIPNASQDDVEMIIAFGKKWGYDFELEAVHKKFCLVNDAVYICRTGDKFLPLEEAKKAHEVVGAQFQHPYVYKTLFSGEPITFNDMCETKQVTKGAMYLDFEHDRPKPETTDGMSFVGRIGRFVPVIQESNGAQLWRVMDGKFFAVSGTKGHLWMEAEMAASLGDKIQIDTTYFDKLVDNAYKTIDKFGDFETFVS